MNEFMKAAMDEAYEGIRHGHGGPFGSVVVKDGKIVGRGHNRVLLKNDPTSHGEMEAIRDACAKLGTFDLSGCHIYTTSQPCPMCLGGVLWANIEKVWYGCNEDDADDIGFRDEKFYDYFEGKTDILEQEELDRDACLELFREYQDNPEQKRY